MYLLTSSVFALSFLTLEAFSVCSEGTFNGNLNKYTRVSKLRSQTK
jgi:hypothetical protein